MAAFRFFLVLWLALSTTSAWSVQERPRAKPQDKERVDEGFTDINQWVEIARDKTSSRRAEAIRVLASIKPDGLAVNQWVEIARDKTSSRRAEAIRVLASIKPDGLTVNQWIEIARDKTSSLGCRVEAICVLGEMEPAGKAAIPTLVEALKDKSLRPHAVRALGDMHSAADEIVPQLLKVMKDKSTLPWACSVLQRLGPSARNVVPSLVKMTEGTDPDARDRASYALALILPDSKFAAWSYLRAPAGTPPNSSAAISSLSRFPPEAVVAACVDLLGQEAPRLRLVALEVLIDMGPIAVTAGSAVVKALDDKDRAVRKSAVFALMRLGVRERLPIRTLAIGLKDQDVEVRVSLADQDPAVGGQAAFALAAIGPPAVPKLVEALKSSSVDVRRLAVVALGKIGPEAATARPALTLLLKDADAEVRMAAAESLRKIGQETGR